MAGRWLAFALAACWMCPDGAPGQETILFHENFEDDLSRWADSGNSDRCCDHSVRLVDEVARWGGRAVRFELRADDPEVNLGVRAEISRPPIQLQPDCEYWFGFSTYLPTNFVPEPDWLLVFQLHGVPDTDLGETWRSPPLALFMIDDQWVVKIRTHTNPVNNNDQDVEGIHKFSHRAGAVTTGAWTDWAFHVQLSHAANGFVRAYRNRTLVVAHDGPTNYNDRSGPYLKLGIYRSPTSTISRTLYHDELWIGSVTANLNAVTPGRKPR